MQNISSRRVMSNRSKTPIPRDTPHSGDLQPTPPTPEQVRRLEEARLRAKAAARQQQNDQALNPPLKRTHSQANGSTATSSDVRSGAGAHSIAASVSDDANILRPSRNLGKYIEYDFAKMTDTKGGFLSVDDDAGNRALYGAERPSKEDEERSQRPAGMTLEEWERMRLIQKLRETKKGLFEPSISVFGAIDEKKDKMCAECESLDLDWQLNEVFGVKVCKKCKKELPDKYSLLTKTEAREDYLLTNPELQDEDLLPHLKRPNPHKSTWNDMQLYLRFQVEEYAFSGKKWGSPEALDEEFERRQKDKKERKEKKFKEKLFDLKKKTRTEAYRRNKQLGSNSEAHFGMKIANDRHVHEWGRPILDADSGLEVKRCIDCGMECEELEL